jgi:PII-like signaling protein
VKAGFTAGKLLKVYLAESHQWEGRPLTDILVERALQAGIAGATVLPGLGGFGHHHKLHTTRLLELSHDLPRVVELVDSTEKIEAFIGGNSAALAGTTLVLIDVELRPAVQAALATT